MGRSSLEGRALQREGTAGAEFCNVKRALGLRPHGSLTDQASTLGQVLFGLRSRVSVGRRSGLRQPPRGKRADQANTSEGLLGRPVPQIQKERWFPYRVEVAGWVVRTDRRAVPNPAGQRPSRSQVWPAGGPVVGSSRGHPSGLHLLPARYSLHVRQRRELAGSLACVSKDSSEDRWGGKREQAWGVALPTSHWDSGSQLGLGNLPPLHPCLRLLPGLPWALSSTLAALEPALVAGEDPAEVRALPSLDASPLPWKSRKMGLPLSTPLHPASGGWGPPQHSTAP